MNLPKLVPAHVLLDPFGVGWIGFEREHGACRAYKPSSEQAQNTDMRANVVEHGTGPQVRGQRPLD